MKVVVVIPTYNERDNISKMIEALALEFPKIKNHKLELLVVDDTSPDKTYEVVREKAKKYKWVHLLLNPEKKGLGKAYATGFKYAMKEMNADYVMEFDGDFQHRPDEIYRLVDKIDEGYEYIIGSRYIPGGSIPKEWGFNRKFLSVVGNLVARVGLLKFGIHDLTTGFKLTKVKGVLEKLDLDHLYSNSFAYKINILAACVDGGAKVVEVPITFMARTEGESKIVKNEMQESLKVIFLYQIHNPKIQRFMKFVVVGGTGFVIQTVIFEVLGVFTHVLSPSVAGVVGGEFAIISNFTLNNIWTFRDYKVGGLKIIGKFLQFNFTSLLALAIQFGILRLGEAVSSGNKLIIQGFYLGAIFIVLIVNYIIYNKIIWKTKS